MAINERADYARVELKEGSAFNLSLKNGDQNKKLSIEVPSDFGVGSTNEAQDLLRTVMLGHIVAAYFPKKIETNFTVNNTQFLSELYKHYGLAEPKIVKSRQQTIPQFLKSDKEESHVKIDIANAHSGGADSLFRLASLVANGENIFAVHLQNLNPKGNSREAVASQKQAQILGVPYENVKIVNNSGNTGFNAMRTRDMLLGLVTAISAEAYSSSKVLVEGGMQTDLSSHFSEFEPAWVFFNKLIKEVGIGSQVEGVDPGDIETIGEILKLEQKLKIDILPLVQNCFCAPFQLPNSRRKWERETPFLSSKSPDHWCGSCLKCRRITLGRIFYKDSKLEKLPEVEVNFFVKDTYHWIKSFPNNHDLISKGFMNCLDSLR